jgi:hypothetical protein
VLTERSFFTPNLAKLRADEALLSTLGVDRLATAALLWQTGYLTFTGARPDRRALGIQPELSESGGQCRAQSGAGRLGATRACLIAGNGSRLLSKTTTWSIMHR